MYAADLVSDLLPVVQRQPTVVEAMPVLVQAEQIPSTGLCGGPLSRTQAAIHARLTVAVVLPPERGTGWLYRATSPRRRCTARRRRTGSSTRRRRPSCPVRRLAPRWRRRRRGAWQVRRASWARRARAHRASPARRAAAWCPAAPRHPPRRPGRTPGIDSPRCT